MMAKKNDVTDVGNEEIKTAETPLNVKMMRGETIATVAPQDVRAFEASGYKKIK